MATTPDGARLGREFGSVNNWLASGQGKDVEIEPGMGVTFLMWSDRHAGTVINVRGKKRRFIEVQRDKEKMVKGHRQTESQQYEFERDPEGLIQTVSFRQGAWRTKGGTVVYFGHRSAYYDPYF